MSDAAQARRGIILYLGLVIAASAVVEGRIITSGGGLSDHGLLLLLLMWVPGLSSLVCRAVLREGVADVSFRLGGRAGAESLAMAWLFPVLVGFVAYGIAWGTRLARFSPPPLPGRPDAGPVLALGGHLGLALTAGLLEPAFLGFGEELGWRGYLLTRLVRARVPVPLVVSGLIWGLWHTPLILSGQYATGPNRWLSAGLFLLSVAGAGVLIGWLRLRSGSVWPAVLAHGSWNVVIQGVFNRATVGAEPGGAAALWIGESGVLVIAVLLTAAGLVLRRFRPVGGPVAMGERRGSGRRKPAPRALS
ncbi:MAG: CPBP family intramembrane glutamic endopeptidase [Gemmatimonadales bacterium]